MKICRWIKDERNHGFKLKGKLRYLTRGTDLNEKRKDSKKAQNVRNGFILQIF